MWEAPCCNQHYTPQDQLSSDFTSKIWKEEGLNISPAESSHFQSTDHPNCTTAPVLIALNGEMGHSEFNSSPHDLETIILPMSLNRYLHFLWLHHTADACSSCN